MFLNSFLQAFVDAVLLQPEDLDFCQQQLVCLRFLLSDSELQGAFKDPKESSFARLWSTLLRALDEFLKDPRYVGLNQCASALKTEVEILQVQEE